MSTTSSATPDIPVMTLDACGDRRWHLHGVLHRDDGPAVIHKEGAHEWWHHGLQHREDGPAVEVPNGTCRWWWYGVRLTSDQHARVARFELSDEQLRIALRLFVDGADIEVAIERSQMIAS